MTVKINGVSFDTKRVMRFAPTSGKLEMLGKERRTW